MQRGEDLGSNLARGGMSAFFQGRFNLCKRGGCRSLRSWIRLQKHQRRALLQFAEEMQSNRVVRFQTSGELIHQAGLPLDQRILVTSQGFEFRDLCQ